MNEELKQFVLAMGALAESLRMFRHELLKNGFSPAEAMRLTEVYLRETISGAFNNNKEDK
jgi:hypothetical protein